MPFREQWMLFTYPTPYNPHNGPHNGRITFGKPPASSSF
jgi:hypothetical protein